MNKADRFYFENCVNAAECACKASDFLVECLKNYDIANISDMLTKMHEFEHAGDEYKHQMMQSLAKAFVTPIDREDLALISQNIDDVTDSIEEVLQCLYINHIETITKEAIDFALELSKCCDYMKEMLLEFSNFKKPKKLYENIVKINDCEEVCDKMYLESVIKIHEKFDDVFKYLAWREFFDKAEECADACEHVGDCVDTVVMKNT